MSGLASTVRSPRDRAWAVRVTRFGPPALIVVLAAVAVVLAGPVVADDNVPLLEPRLPLLLLLACWIAFEFVMVQIRLNDDPDQGEDLKLTEVPLVLGLLMASPLDLLVAAVAGGALVDLLQGRLPVVKTIFNTAKSGMEVAVALTLYRALAPAEPLSPQGWAVLALVVVVSGTLSSAAVTLVISLATARLPDREALRRMMLSAPMPLLAATLVLVVAGALGAGAWLAAPILALGVALLALLQRLSVLTERHDHLIALNRLAQRVSSADTRDAVVAEALECAADLLFVREATAHVVAPGDDLLHWRWDDEAGARRVEGLPPVGVVPGTMGRTSLVVSAPVTEGHDLLLSVSGRVQAARPFREEDRRVLEMIARQAAVHLHTAALIEQLRHDSRHDPFTDLPNRRAMVEVLESRMGDAEATEVVLVGVRDLDAVNEALGHDHGDELVRQVGSRLRQVAGPRAGVGRVGEHDFAVVRPVGDGPDHGAEMVASLIASLGGPFTLGKVQALLAASAGVVTQHAGDGTDAKDLFRRAGIALRHAERTGQPVAHYCAELETATPSRLALAADLRAAVTRGELRLYGQPQIRLGDGAVVGVEALLRWEHPHLGLLGPDTFIPLAVQTGLDRAVTAWVVNAAVKVLAGWQSAGLDLTLSVNVSASALIDQHLPELVEELLELRGVPGERLVVELTESDLLASPAAAEKNLNRLAELGVGVSVDDFGTGYSSLSHLRRLPVDEVKIDRSFVLAMLDDLDSAAIVRSLIHLSNELGLRCVAEGVEEPAVRSALQRLGCEMAQGYLIAKPMPLADVAGWTRAKRPAVTGGTVPAVS